MWKGGQVFKMKLDRLSSYSPTKLLPGYSKLWDWCYLWGRHKVSPASLRTVVFIWARRSLLSKGPGLFGMIKKEWVNVRLFQTQLGDCVKYLTQGLLRHPLSSVYEKRWGQSLSKEQRKLLSCVQKEIYGLCFHHEDHPRILGADLMHHWSL